MARKNASQGVLPFVEVVPESLGNNVIEVRSTSNPNVVYRVDTVKGRCSCPAWIFQRGVRKPCKHLQSMGIFVTQEEPVPEPVKAEAMEQVDLDNYL